MNAQSTKFRSTLSAGVAAAAVVLGGLSGNAVAVDSRPVAEASYLDLSPEIRLRRMVVRKPANQGTPGTMNPKGTVLFLHGFPETMLAWQEVARTLGQDYEVHAFDWPGYGDSSRPTPDVFAYAPRDYANVLTQYIDKAGIDRRNLVIYATDIGALPALLAALDQPDLAKTLIVGDFAPFNRPEYMQGRLQALKEPKSAEVVRQAFNATRDEILRNAFARGLPDASGYSLHPDFQADMARGWSNGALTSGDAFYHYYTHFTRDQDAFESGLQRLKTPVKVVWGEQDIYISKDMGVEFARRTNAPLRVLPGTGHYPHLQHPEQTVDEVRDAFR